MAVQDKQVLARELELEQVQEQEARATAHNHHTHNKLLTSHYHA